MDANRFQNFRTITANFSGPATCKHPVQKYDRIGWNRFTKATKCCECWRQWEQENAEAAAAESGYGCY